MGKRQRISGSSNPNLLIAVGEKPMAEGGQSDELRRLQSVVGDDVVHISCGLGGEGTRLRCWFLISTLDDNTITDSQAKLIEHTFIRIAKRMDSRIEHCEVKLNYVTFVALMSLDSAVGELIERGIRKTNSSEEILRFHYFVVNTHIPVQNEIDQYLNEWR